MKSLTNDQREEIKEIFDWGHFMDSAMKYRQDAGGIVCDNCGTHYLTEEFLLEEYYKKIFPEEY